MARLHLVRLHLDRGREGGGRQGRGRVEVTARRRVQVAAQLGRGHFACDEGPGLVHVGNIFVYRQEGAGQEVVGQSRGKVETGKGAGGGAQGTQGSAEVGLEDRAEWLERLAERRLDGAGGGRLGGRQDVVLVEVEVDEAGGERVIIMGGVGRGAYGLDRAAGQGRFPARQRQRKAGGGADRGGGIIGRK